MRGLPLGALALAATSLGSALPADRDDATVASSAAQRFVDLVRVATDRYHDRARAVADGYRLIGRDFPGMGEHWVNVGLLFDGAYEPTRPEFLSYVTIDGAPRLLGVAYGLPLLAGEQPPDEPAGRAAWHAHAGTVEEETLLPHHHHSDHGGRGPRLAMVHAWVWLANPNGVFAADNWSIPFARLGLPPPEAPAVAAAKALSLLTGGDEYVAEAVARTRLSTEPARSVGDALSRARSRVEAVLRGRPRHVQLGHEELDALSAEWERLWNDIDRDLTPEARERLRSSAAR